jgi:hypothetical protein
VYNPGLDVPVGGLGNSRVRLHQLAMPPLNPRGLEPERLCRLDVMELALHSA